MNATELITRAKRAGFVFHLDGDQMHCRLSKPADFRTRPLALEIRQHKDEIIATLKLEAPNDFPGGAESKSLSCDLEAGEIVAVLIASTVLAADIWLSFRDDFNPQDGKAVFYGHELAMLKTKTPEELRAIHRVKLTFGAGAKVRQ